MVLVAKCIQGERIYFFNIYKPLAALRVMGLANGWLNSGKEDARFQIIHEVRYGDMGGGELESAIMCESEIE